MLLITHILFTIAFLTTGSAQAAAESVSSLLEKGIYTEETVGDVDGAMKIYQQIVTDEQAGRRYAAQAQFRLAMCHLKKKQTDQATAAFEKLIADYPDQKELIAQARKHVPAEPFPEFQGCRQIVSIDMSPVEAKPGWEKAEPTASKSLYEGSGLDFSWTIPESIAGKTRAVWVGVRPIKAENNEAPDYKLEGTIKNLSTQSIQFSGKSLTAGSYLAIVAACSIDPKGKLNPAEVVGVATLKLEVKPPVYSQISISDIQPDGTIKSRYISNEINSGTEDRTKLNFNCSDFMRFKGMKDENGKAMEFTEKHDSSSSLYRYVVTLNEPVPPGKFYCYSAESTATSLIKPVQGQKDVLEYKMQHWPGANTVTRRVEVYRLPAGAELMETGPANMARRVKDGRTELYVEKLIPPRGSILTSFRYRLPGGAATRAATLQLQPEPWSDGEEMELRLLAPAGAEMGTILYDVRSDRRGEQDVWRIESRMLITANGMQQYTRVDASKKDFAPLFGRTMNTATGDFKADYSPGKAVLTAANAEKNKPTTLDVPDSIYDNEQALQLIRRMPLAEGYHGQFNIFPVTGGQIVECRIVVTGKEKVAVKAGEYDCYKVDLSVYLGEICALKHKLWFSADAHRYLVKYDAETAVMELTRVRTLSPKDKVAYKDSELRFTLEAPAGWFMYKDPAPKPQKSIVQLLPPELDTWATLALAPVERGDTSARKIAEADIESLKDFFKGYMVRPASWTELKVAGSPAARFEADYQDKGKDMVEYRTYILGKTTVYWFVFRIEKSDFQKNKPVYDGIMDSFKTGSE